VVLFHAYARWPEIVPFGDRFTHVPVLAQGKVGVSLFFLISGYVIFMTLERSAGFVDFMRRRWLRLWPAMFAVSLFVFATAALFTRPAGEPVMRDLLPGLTFVEPAAWSWLLGSPQGVLEGSFWTLFVEMKFYIVVSALYFTVGARGAIAGLIGMFFAPYLVGRLPSPIPSAIYASANFLDSWYWGWFAAGALYFKAQPNSWKLTLAAFLLSLVAAYKMEPALQVAAVVVAVLFGAAQISHHLRRFLSQRWFVFLGAISYPLYLIHENMMVSMIGSVGRALPALPAVFVPVVPIAIVVFLGWVFATYIEPAVKHAVRTRSFTLAPAR
jgi:peptidoglycan/LPS O-acetylase OafA/YrhL